MWFWVYMLLSSFLIPVLMFLVGRMMLKHPPKRINGIYGYRTSRSMKNMETWNFAHEVCGKLWQKTGLVLLVVTMCIQVFLFGKSDEVVGTAAGILCVLQCVCLVATIIPVENKLKANFDSNGERRSL